ncbi:unnamed protein product [Effrenium voratum]|nr:unnamed protein product [Effrenium voratum]
MAAEKASLSSGQPRSSFRERTPGGGVSRFLRSGSRSHSEAREAKQSPGFVARPPQAVPARRLYRVTTRGLGIRAGPSVDGPRTGALLRRGDIFEASVVAPGVDGRIYLKLAGWRGWAFDDSAVDPEVSGEDAMTEDEFAAWWGQHHQQGGSFIDALRRTLAIRLRVKNFRQLALVCGQDKLSPESRWIDTELVVMIQAYPQSGNEELVWAAGKTPMDLAREYGKTEVLCLLSEAR